MPSYPAFKGTVCFQPHVVILGAGASRAAFPNGDANGTKLPLMTDFVEIVGLGDLLERNGLDYRNKNFETLYDEIVAVRGADSFTRILNERIYEYFAGLQIPDEPTLYDYLVLSLRGKDVIATFNWDPFLALAYQRNYHVGEMPHILFMHGNVQVGVCHKDRSKGFIWQKCSNCGEILTPTELLYPVGHKNYSNNPFLANEWQELRTAIQHAYLLTFFGYSAPKTDADARGLMLDVWKRNETSEFGIVSVVDVKQKVELEKTWSEFLVNYFYFCQDVWQTNSFCYPRRSCDADIGARFQQKPWKENKIPTFKSLEELQKWFAPLVEEEQLYSKSGVHFSDTLKLL